MSVVSPPPPQRPPVYTLPNALTASRLVLAVVLFWCIANAYWAVGLAVFALAALTDWLDGYVARLQNLTSSLGRQFDPLVDKVLICGAFIYLLPVPEANLQPWMVTVVVARELLITGLRGYLENLGATFGADWLGKIKMILQCADLSAVLLLLCVGDAVAWLPVAVAVLTYAMLAATILSGVQYLWRAALALRG